MEKASLRRKIAERKRSLSPAQIHAASQKLARQLFLHPLYREASTLYAYLSYNQEVRTDAIIRQALSEGKNVAVPKIFGQTMRFVRIREDSRIVPGYKGIPEPADNDIIRDETALVLVPGLAFRADGHRLGYGGGFYDRFLAKEVHPTIALCYDFQLTELLPVQEHDIPVDVVLSTAVEEEST